MGSKFRSFLQLKKPKKSFQQWIFDCRNLLKVKFSDLLATNLSAIIVICRYFPADIQMHSFDYGDKLNKKRDNWKLLMEFFKRRGLPIVIKDPDSLINNDNNSTIEFVKQVYTLLTERALMPPIKVYDTENQEQQSLLLKEREMVKLPQNDLDIMDQDNEESKQEQSVLKESTSRSPQKSLAITKGPQRTIPQTLELDSYKAIEVKEIQIKQINQSVAQIRAHKEFSSLHSQGQNAQKSEIQSQMNVSQNRSQHRLAGAGDGASRIFSSETMREERQAKKSLTDILNDLIIIKNQQDKVNNEISQIRVDGDIVTSFFDNANKFSDEFTQSFLEDLQNELESILNVAYNNAGELSLFFTFLIMMLRRLSHLSTSFYSCMQFCKNLAIKISQDNDSPKTEFQNFFIKHLFRAYLQIAKEDSNKRTFIAELIYAHTSSDLSLRIKIVQDLKTHIKQEDVLYSILSYLVSQEESFNEEWFDVFLYYALVGLCKSRPIIRTFSLKILNTISKFNPEGILDVTEKVKALSISHHWEVKAQSMLFACNILRHLRAYSFLLRNSKEEGGDQNKNMNPTSRGDATSQPPPNSKIDRNYAKQLLTDNLEIISNCFGANVPKSVQKLGLFELQDLLNDFKILYKIYVEVFLGMDPDIKVTFNKFIYFYISKLKF